MFWLSLTDSLLLETKVNERLEYWKNYRVSSLIWSIFKDRLRNAEAAFSEENEGEIDSTSIAFDRNSDACLLPSSRSLVLLSTFS